MMKKVPKRRFKGFLNAGDWEQRKLGEIASINPRTELPNSFKYVDLESVIGTNLIGCKKIEKENAPSRAQRLASFGDIFYQTVRPYQRNNYLFEKDDDDVVFSTGYAQLRSELDSYFLFTLIQTDSFVRKVLDNCTGTSYPAINSSELGKILISVPQDKLESHQIGTVFRILDNVITLHQRKLEKLQATKKALLYELFPIENSRRPKRRFKGFTDDWEQRKLGEITERYDNLRVPITANLRIPGNTPYYGANGIQDYVEGHTHEGEFVLVAEDGANDLKNYPVQFVNGRIWVNNHAHVLQGKKDIIDNHFLAYAIRRTNMGSLLVGGSRPKLNAETLMKIAISVPEIEEQRMVGTQLNQFDNLITLHQRKLEKLKNLKAAYLNEMFV